MPPRCPFPLSLPRFPRSVLPDFSCIHSRFMYSASLYVSFRPTSFNSHSRSTSAYLPLSIPVFSPSTSGSFVPVLSGSDYSAFCFFRSVLPASASQWLPQCFASALASTFSPVHPDWFPIQAFLVIVLGFLLVSFRATLLRSHSCSTGDHLFPSFNFP